MRKEEGGPAPIEDGGADAEGVAAGGSGHVLSGDEPRARSAAPAHGGPEDVDDREATTVSVEFDLTPEEWVEVAVEHNLGSEVYRSALRNGQRAFGLLVLLIALLAFLGGYGTFAFVWLFAGGVAAVLLPKSFERSQRRQYRKIAEGGITNGMFGTHRVHLLESGLVDETDAYHRLTRWHAVERVVDGPGAFMIYFGSDAFLPVPHSAFRDAEALRAFGDRFFEHVGSGPDGRVEGSQPAAPRLDEGGPGG